MYPDSLVPIMMLAMITLALVLLSAQMVVRRWLFQSMYYPKDVRALVPIIYSQEAPLKWRQRWVTQAFADACVGLYDQGVKIHARTLAPAEQTSRQQIEIEVRHKTGSTIYRGLAHFGLAHFVGPDNTRISFYLFSTTRSENAVKLPTNDHDVSSRKVLEQAMSAGYR